MCSWDWGGKERLTEVESVKDGRQRTVLLGKRKERKEEGDREGAPGALYGLGDYDAPGDRLCMEAEGKGGRLCFVYCYLAGIVSINNNGNSWADPADLCTRVYKV